LAEVVVEGDTLTKDTELVADFTVLKKILREELAKIDHCVLNERPPFDAINPSSENIARYLWKCMEPRLKEYPVKLYSVSISEKAAQTATYREITD
jgi:6-pyruvoyltetrahydropterin/6-carboxytetrahydropterin synthase